MSKGLANRVKQLTGIGMEFTGDATGYRIGDKTISLQDITEMTQHNWEIKFTEVKDYAMTIERYYKDQYGNYYRACYPSFTPMLILLVSAGKDRHIYGRVTDTSELGFMHYKILMDKIDRAKAKYKVHLNEAIEQYKKYADIDSDMANHLFQLETDFNYQI